MSNRRAGGPPGLTIPKQRPHPLQQMQAIDQAYILKGNKIAKPPKGSADEFDTETWNKLVRGQLDVLPTVASSEVRIFLSSTFSDFKEERNYLVQNAFPSLKDFCASNGLDLRVCDMRWGVTDSAVNEHLVERLCLEEIANCRRVSVGPFFIGLIGNRYGYQPIPPEIESEEFHRLLELASEVSSKSGDILKEWYKEDTNAVPPVFMLLPIKSKFPKYGDYSDESARREAGNAWWRVEEGIRHTIRRAVNRGIEKEIYQPSHKFIYSRGVTESEIAYALSPIDSAIPTTERCFFYIRELTGFRTSLEDELSTKYADTVLRRGETVLLEEPQELLQALRTRIRQSGAKVREFQVPWSPEGIQSEFVEAHQRYVDQLTTYIIRDLKGAMQRCLPATSERAIDKWKRRFQTELVHQQTFCRTKSTFFCGRVEELESVRKLWVDKASQTPIVLYAESGCGKTAFMAQVARLVPQWFGPNSVNIVRFMGTSAYSTTIYHTLFSVCQQISHAYKIKLPTRKIQTIKSLRAFMPRLLHTVSVKAARQFPLVIVLDSIDQLQDKGAAYTCYWLPTSLPRGVHIIVSTLPQEYGILASLKERIKVPENFLQLDRLCSTAVCEILDTFGIQKGRKLTDNQREHVLSRLPSGTLSPLFLKLVLDQAFRWSSFIVPGLDIPPDKLELNVSSTVQEAIDLFFQKLEIRYGKILIEATFGYLTVAQNGISEVELEDALSCNDSVLNDVYRFHDPPMKGVVRIPSLLWSRIHRDIAEYVTEKRTDGKLTISWYHRQFHEVATKRYVGTASRRRRLHANLADLFSATDGVARTIVLSNAKRHLEIPNADRLVCLSRISEHNPRKLHALPYHLMHSDNMTALLDRCVANLNFLLSFYRAFGIQECVDWLKTCHDHFPSCPQLTAVLDCFTFIQPYLDLDPDSLPIQLIGQLKRTATINVAEMIASFEDPFFHLIDMANSPESILDHQGARGASPVSHTNLITRSNFENTDINLQVPPLWGDRCSSPMIHDAPVPRRRDPETALDRLCYQSQLDLAKKHVVALIPTFACLPSCLGGLKWCLERVESITPILWDDSLLIICLRDTSNWIIKLFSVDDCTSLCRITLDSQPIKFELNQQKTLLFILDTRFLYVYDADSGIQVCRHGVYINNKSLLNQSLGVTPDSSWIAIAAEDRIALLANRGTDNDKRMLSHQILLMAKEVDRTIALLFLTLDTHHLLITGHTYRIGLDKQLIVKCWMYEKRTELWSLSLATLPASYPDQMTLLPADGTSLLCILPDATVHRIDAITAQSEVTFSIDTARGKMPRVKSLLFESCECTYSMTCSVDKTTSLFVCLLHNGTPKRLPYRLHGIVEGPRVQTVSCALLTPDPGANFLVASTTGLVGMNILPPPSSANYDDPPTHSGLKNAWPAHQDRVTFLRWKDDRRLYTFSPGDHVLKLWDYDIMASQTAASIQTNDSRIRQPSFNRSLPSILPSHPLSDVPDDSPPPLLEELDIGAFCVTFSGRGLVTSSRNVPGLHLWSLSGGGTLVKYYDFKPVEPDAKDGEAPQQNSPLLLTQTSTSSPLKEAIAIDWDTVDQISCLAADQYVVVSASNGIFVISLNDSGYILARSPRPLLWTPVTHCGPHSSADRLCLLRPTELQGNLKKGEETAGIEILAVPGLQWVCGKRFLPPVGCSDAGVRKLVCSGDAQWTVVVWRGSGSGSTRPQAWAAHLTEPGSSITLVPCTNEVDKNKNKSMFMGSGCTQPVHSVAPILGSKEDGRSLLVGGLGEIYQWDLLSTAGCKLPRVPQFHTFFKHSVVVNLASPPGSADIRDSSDPFGGDHTPGSPHAPPDFNASPNTSKNKGSKSSGIDPGKFDKHPITALYVSSQGEVVVSGGNTGNIIIWWWRRVIDLQGREPDPIHFYRRLIRRAHSAMVTCLTLSNDTTLLASGGADKYLMLSDTISGSMLHRILLHMVPTEVQFAGSTYTNGATGVEEDCLVGRADHMGCSKLILFNIVRQTATLSTSRANSIDILNTN